MTLSRVLLGGVLITLLVGCGETKYIDRPYTVYREVPENLIPVCYDRPFTGETIGDRLTWADKVEQDVDLCNIDIDSLEEWRESREDPSP